MFFFSIPHHFFLIKVSNYSWHLSVEINRAKTVTISILKCEKWLNNKTYISLYNNDILLINFSYKIIKYFTTIVVDLYIRTRVLFTKQTKTFKSFMIFSNTKKTKTEIQYFVKRWWPQNWFSILAQFKMTFAKKKHHI